MKEAQLQKLKEKLARLHKEESKLSETARASKKKYQDWELTKGVDPSAVEKAFRNYIEIGGRLSALRQRIIRQQTELSELNFGYQEDSEVSETSDRETEERFLTLMALITELQVDMLGKEAQYEAVSKTQPVKKSVLRQASELFGICRTWSGPLRELLVKARADQERCDRRHAERMKPRSKRETPVNRRPPLTIDNLFSIGPNSQLPIREKQIPLLRSPADAGP